MKTAMITVTLIMKLMIQDVVSVGTFSSTCENQYTANSAPVFYVVPEDIATVQDQRLFTSDLTRLTYFGVELTIHLKMLPSS